MSPISTVAAAAYAIRELARTHYAHAAGTEPLDLRRTSPLQLSSPAALPVPISAVSMVVVIARVVFVAVMYEQLRPVTSTVVVCASA